MNLLITGAAGFIGSNFIHYWRDKNSNDKIIGLDNLTYAGNKANLLTLINDGSIHFVKGSIGDFVLVRELLIENSINTIVHFAAESHVDRSIEGPDQFIETNILGTHTLLKAAREVWLDRGNLEDHLFHHVSTDEVYGDITNQNIRSNEQHPYKPSSPYSASKASADHLILSYVRTFKLKAIISNCCNNYGPKQFPEKLIPKMVFNIINNRNTAKIILNYVYLFLVCSL